MNWEILKRYLKKRLIGIPAFIIIFSLLYLLIKDKSYSYAYVGLWLLGFIQGFFSFSKRQLYLADLEKKGLIEKEVNDSAFVKQWEENRERGLLKYCIIDGAIITGALLSIGVGIIGMFILNTRNEHLFSAPGEIFCFIGYCYLIGAIIGVISYRATWSINEKKFNRLTDPLH